MSKEEKESGLLTKETVEHIFKNVKQFNFTVQGADGKPKLSSLVKHNTLDATSDQNAVLQSNGVVAYTEIRKGNISALQAGGTVRDGSENMPAHIRAVELAEKEIVAKQLSKTRAFDAQRP